MRIDFDSVKPVYVQIAEAIEDDIISGKLEEGSSAYSQLMIARALQVNPATAAKGINVLVSSGILAKQRGSTMIVAQGALARLLNERKGKHIRHLIENLVLEANKVKLSEEDVLREIKRYYQSLEGKRNE